MKEVKPDFYCQVSVATLCSLTTVYKHKHKKKQKQKSKQGHYNKFCLWITLLVHTDVNRLESEAEVPTKVWL